MPDARLEQALTGYVVGVDEAGCGPWAGPVVAGAAILDFQQLSCNFIDQLNDSKKLSRVKRNAVYQLLCQYQGCGVMWAFGLASVIEIEQFNIRRAALLAMRRAVDQLPIQPDHALVDGTVAPNLPCPVTTVIRGDSLSLSIAAASIIAKVERDHIMQKLAFDFPEYHWQKNAGYGTKLHQQALNMYGITPHHRKSFQPIARLLQR